MIVVDIETSGGDFVKCGIWQIGAVELEKPENIFLQEGRIDDEESIVQSTNLGNVKTVEEVTGKTEEQMKDKNLQSQKQLLENFFKWCEKIRIKNFICHNIQFDYSFIWVKANKYSLKVPFPHRGFDLPTIAQTKYFKLYGRFLIKENSNDMGLKNVLNLCGMEDNRQYHNALEDAKLTAECFSRLIYGKNLFPEYNKYSIPDNLRK